MPATSSPVAARHASVAISRLRRSSSAYAAISSECFATISRSSRRRSVVSRAVQAASSITPTSTCATNSVTNTG